MARYEFYCEDCKELWEKHVSIHKAPKRSRCPSCNKLRGQTINPPAIHFKGGGWYADKTKRRNELNNKDQLKRFYNQSMQDSEDRMKEPRYRQMDINYDYMQEKGILRETKGKEKERRNKSAEFLATTLLQQGAKKYDTIKVKDKK